MFQSQHKNELTAVIITIVPSSKTTTNHKPITSQLIIISRHSALPRPTFPNNKHQSTKQPLQPVESILRHRRARYASPLILLESTALPLSPPRKIGDISPEWHQILLSQSDDKNHPSHSLLTHSIPCRFVLHDKVLAHF